MSFILVHTNTQHNTHTFCFKCYSCSWTGSAGSCTPTYTDQTPLISRCCPKYNNRCLLTLPVRQQGKQETWAASLNLWKTPLFFSRTGGADVFISTCTPWPKGNKPTTENNVLVVFDVCLEEEHTHTNKKCKVNHRRLKLYCSKCGLWLWHVRMNPILASRALSSSHEHC